MPNVPPCCNHGGRGVMLRAAAYVLGGAVLATLGAGLWTGRLWPAVGLASLWLVLVLATAAQEAFLAVRMAAEATEQEQRLAALEAIAERLGKQVEEINRDRALSRL